MGQLKLRDYQARIIDDIRNSLRQVSCTLAVAPTGAGKTALASFIAGQTAANGRVCWFICHRAELVHQTSLTFAKFGIDHGIISAGMPQSPAKLVQVCSIDTLKNRMGKLIMPDVAIYDEAHHASAAGWRKVISQMERSKIIGLSATPIRLDGRGLDDLFDDIVIGPSVAWLIEQGHLSPYEVYAPSQPDMTGVAKRAGDYAKKEAAERADKPKLIGDAIEHWRRHANGMQSVAFCVNIAHSQHVAEQFSAAGIPAAHLDGSSNKAERARIIERFALGEIKVLSNVDLFGEGFDLAAIAQRDVTIDCVLQMRPTQSLSLHLQQVGRALRPKPGKTAIILDHAGNCQKHGFADDDREWTLEGREKGQKASTMKGPPPPANCPGCYRQLRVPLPDQCPSCGHNLRPKIEAMEAAAGELEKQTDEHRRQIAIARKEEDSKAWTMQELVALAAKRGYTNPQGWAYRKFTARQQRK